MILNNVVRTSRPPVMAFVRLLPWRAGRPHHFVYKIIAEKQTISELVLQSHREKRFSVSELSYLCALNKNEAVAMLAEDQP